MPQPPPQPPPPPDAPEFPPPMQRPFPDLPPRMKTLYTTELRRWLTDLAENPEEIGPGWVDTNPPEVDWIPEALPIDPDTLLPLWWPHRHPTTRALLTLRQRQTWFLWSLPGDLAPIAAQLRAGPQSEARRLLARSLCQLYLTTPPSDRPIPDSL